MGIEVRQDLVRDSAGARKWAGILAEAPLDWLLAIAETMEEGESRTVSLWVRSMDLAALLHATPVMAGTYARLACEADEEAGTAPIRASPSPRLRVVAAGS